MGITGGCFLPIEGFSTPEELKAVRLGLPRRPPILIAPVRRVRLDQADSEWAGDADDTNPLPSGSPEHAVLTPGGRVPCRVAQGGAATVGGSECAGVKSTC
ncbi:hypothetical protein SBV1_1220014 [Verrucomicrobia bacterium]|nr:hypothetical protein SBV1_1220014 [Verrucomicrobiota bacterium]